MELVLLIGLQASGKSSFYRARFSATHDLVSKDLFPHHRRPEQRQRTLIERALSAGRNVVVDNTNATVVSRKPLLDLGRAFGAEIAGYYLASRGDDCLARNRLRAGRARVPDVAILATLKQLERPSSREGFARLFHVDLAQPNEFVVTPWIEEREPS